MTVAVILAGGLGTRLRSAVPNLPKPMADVCGKPFLEHLIHYWIGQGVSRFVVSVGYKRESITSHFGSGYRGVPIDYVEEEVPLGTGGGLLIAAMGLYSPFILLNGDTFFQVNLEALLKFHKLKKSELSFSLFRANESNRYGGVLIDNNRRIWSLDTAKGNEGALVNGGVYVVEPDTLNSAGFKIGHKYSLEDDVIPKLLGRNMQIFGFESEGKFLDIGVPEDYFRAADILPKIGDC